LIRIPSIKSATADLVSATGAAVVRRRRLTSAMPKLAAIMDEAGEHGDQRHFKDTIGSIHRSLSKEI
jgi:hypothetical protein